MKNKILLTAAGLVGIATTLGVGTVLFAQRSEVLTRLTGVSIILGLGSMGLFFVALAIKE